MNHFRRSVMVLLVCLFALISNSGNCAEFRIGLVLDKGGKDDKSFNAAAVRGVSQAEKELGAKMKYVEASDDNAYETMIRSFAQKDYDLIVSVGFAQAESLRKVAPKFPDKHFIIVDADVNLPNVRSLMFEEHEGSFLVGAIAGLVSKTGTIGYIGGMDVPLIRRFELGYKAGAQKVNSKIKLISNFIGVTGDSWNNPAKAKELALAQYSTGADVIFAAAGASNSGLMDAAEETKKFAIGVDSNQNWMKPGFVLTSMLKRVDAAVFDACKESKEKKFTGGVKHYGLSNQGVDYALDQYNDKLLTPAIRSRVEQLKKEIVSGKIKVPDFYKLKK